MRARIPGYLITCLVLGIISGCSTTGKLESWKEGIKFPSLASLTHKSSNSTSEIERRADQLVRIQEYAAAEDLYSEILQREPKNQTIQQKLTDLQWKKRGVETPGSAQSIAVNPQQRSLRDSERSVSQSTYRPNRSNTPSQPLTRDRAITKPLDELSEMMASNPRVTEANHRPVDRSFSYSSNEGEYRIPEWARDDAFEDNRINHREFTPQPAVQNQIRSNLERQKPLFDQTDPFLREEPIRREVPLNQSRRPVAQQGTPQAAPSASYRDETWSIMITPKPKSSQNVQYGTRPLPGVARLKEVAPRGTNTDGSVGRAPLPEGPAVASVRDFPPQQNSSSIQPVSEHFDHLTRSGLATTQPAPFPVSAEPAPLAERLNTLSDAELQERVLNRPQDSVAINEVFQRLGSPNRETRWRAANTIEVLSYQPESKSIVLAEFAQSISDNDPVLREQALRVLQGMPEQSNQLRDLIRQRLADDNEHVRAAAESALQSTTR